MSRAPKIERKTTRCAIHTRKSSEEGLEQQFNSLDAQRESAEAYIASQRAEGCETPARRASGQFQPARRWTFNILLEKTGCGLISS